MKNKSPLIFITLFFSLLALPFALAQFDTSYSFTRNFYNINLMDILRSDLMIFFMLWMAAFLLVYISLKRIILGEEQALATILGLVIGFIIAYAGMNYVDKYLLPKTAPWYVVLALAILGIFIVAKGLIKLGKGLTWITILYIVAYIVTFWFNIVPYSIKSQIPQTAVTVLSWIFVAAAFSLVIRLLLAKKWARSASERADRVSKLQKAKKDAEEERSLKRSRELQETIIKKKAQSEIEYTEERTKRERLEREQREKEIQDQKDREKQDRINREKQEKEDKKRRGGDIER